MVKMSVPIAWTTCILYAKKDSVGKNKMWEGYFFNKSNLSYPYSEFIYAYNLIHMF